MEQRPRSCTGCSLLLAVRYETDLKQVALACLRDQSPASQMASSAICMKLLFSYNRVSIALHKTGRSFAFDSGQECPQSLWTCYHRRRSLFGMSYSHMVTI